MKNLCAIILLLACQIIAAQKQPAGKIATQHKLISVDAYKARVKRELTKQDSLLFITFDNKLLVKVDDHVDMSKSRPFEFRDSTFLELYKNVAFNPSKKDQNGKVFHRYWKQPLKIYVSPSISKGSKKFLENLTDEIKNGIDSLKISFVKDLNDANFVLYSNGDFDYEPKITGKHDYYVYWNGRNQIYKAYIKVDQTMAFNETLLNNMIREHFIVTLGYFTLTDKIRCSNLLANCYDPTKSLSSLDKELIKYHYSYGICKGIELSTFNELHEKGKKHLKSKSPTVYRIMHP